MADVVLTTLVYGVLRQLQEERDIRTSELIAATATVIGQLADNLAEGARNRDAARQIADHNQ